MTESTGSTDPSGTTRSSGTRVARVAFELALIIVGVLIALAVDEWRQARDQASSARAALALVSEELTRNARTAREEREHHMAVAKANRDALDVLRKTNRFEPPADELGDVRPSTFTRSGYDAMLQAGVGTVLSADALAAIARAYEAQETYRDTSQRYLSALLLVDFMDGSRFFQLKWFWAETLAEREQSLIPLLEQASQAVLVEQGRL